MKRRITPFTLIELLVVVGIIAILAGILLPTISIAIRKTNVAKAKTEMSSLIAAITMFQSEYDVMPFPFIDGLNTKRLDDSDLDISGTPYYEVLISFLSQTGAHTAVKNPRKIKFLDVQKAGLFNDPWGKPYRIVYDSNYSGEVQFGLAPGLVGKGSETTIPRSILIYSSGPDGATNTTASHASNQDNVYSIETVWVSTQGHVLQ